MDVNWKSLLSVLGIPMLGVGALIVSLGHPPSSWKSEANDSSMMLLVDPNPKLDKSLTICLRQQAKQVLLFQKQARPERLSQAIDDYNLVARECTPAVFQATHLPTSWDL
jgi:hypothetical protein